MSGCYNFTEFCHGLTRKSPEGLRRCIECDKKGVGIYLCHAGLVDFAAPITLEDGTLLGNIVGGQVLPARPDKARFRATARELSIDEDAYIKALRKVSVRSEEQIEASLNLLANVINQFVRASYASYMDAAALRERSRIISSLSRIYFCDYYLDLENDRFIELDATPNLHEFVGSSGVSSVFVPSTIERFAEEAYRDDFLAFADLTTMRERMAGRPSISLEFPAIGIGWCRALFIAVDVDAEGKPRHVIYAIQDIQEEKRRDLEARQRLKAAADAAQRANEAKSDFLSRMSHDIRTPLNGIMGMTHIAELQDNPPRTQDCLAKIGVSSQFLLGLVNDVLDMSKVESGAIELHLEPYPFEDFTAYLDAVIRPLCAAKKQHFELVVDPRRQGVVPLLDRLRTSQVVFNILSNAVKYTPEGGTITYHVEEQLLAGRRIAFTHTVTDTGIGMSEGFMQHLFEPFVQEGRDDVSEQRGSGLGLAIVKRLIDAMGGTIEVASTQGVGTTFTVRLEFDYIDASSVPSEHSERHESETAGTALAGRHVLVCEDHPLNREIALALLSERGVKADVAGDGMAGVTRFVASPVDYYDCVLMDIRMPTMDGYAATEAIRALDRADAATVPIVAMTADAYSDDVDRCLRVGMDGHIAKPVEPAKLYELLTKLCAEGRPSAR